MAAIVSEQYTWKPTVINQDATPDPAPEQSVAVYVWDNDGTLVVDGDSITTDAQGTITAQNLINAIYSITGTTTVATNEETPHTIRFTKWTGTTAFEILNVQSEIVQGSTPTFFIVENANITIALATVAAYTNITINDGGESITVSSARTLNELYHFAYREATINPEVNFPQLIQTADGVNYLFAYDLLVTAGTLDGENRNIAMASGKDVTISGTGNITNTQITGDVALNAATNLTNVTIVGDLRINTGANSTLTFDNVTVTGSVFNDAASNTLTIQATNGSSLTAGDPGTGVGQTDIQNAVTIEVTVLDENGSPLSGARVFVEAAAGGPLAAGTDLINEETTGTGIVSTSINFSSNQPITGRVRRSTTAPLYKTAPITGTVTAAGFSVTIQMIRDD